MLLSPGRHADSEKLFDKIREEWEQFEIVVANAAFGFPGNMMDATAKYWDITMAAGILSDKRQ